MNQSNQLSEFSGVCVFKKTVYLKVEYTYHCGDGCCTDYDTVEEEFQAGERVALFRRGYSLSLDLSTFSGNGREDPRAQEWQIKELLEEGAIELLPDLTSTQEGEKR